MGVMGVCGSSEVKFVPNEEIPGAGDCGSLNFPPEMLTMCALRPR